MQNNICIIAVEVNAQKVFLSHKFMRIDVCATHPLRRRWCCAWNTRHQSTATSVYWRHELARPAAAFLPYFFAV